ncbi:MAG TPA: FHA domain-containing protein [Anaerolineaceae bacterium]|nr:FHA domain-containing protein [Anaerolineaceae bacterium]HPN53676.1 FHA domain-containing protein [Anaerolineaceae bacterium]
MEPSPNTPCLVAREGPLEGQQWSLVDEILIGREGACQVIIADRQVSRYHARLSASENGVLLEDLSSKNGTFCNGTPVVEPVLLKEGDIIQVATLQSFIFLSSDVTMPLAASPAAKQTPQSAKPDSAAPIPPLRMENRSRRVWVKGVEMTPPLSLQQYNLLQSLYDNAGQVVSREELVEAIWGNEQADGISEQALDALIRRLRDRLAELDPDHTYIVTVRGHGLRLDMP